VIVNNPPISTKRTIASHLNSLNTNKGGPQHMRLEIQVLDC